jgi:hypothetical protein
MRQLNGLYTRSLSGLFLGLAGQDTGGLISAFTSLLPDAARPFQISAAQIGFQFFNMRRDMAAQNARGSVPTNKLTLDMFDIDKIAQNAMSGLLAEIGFSMSKGLQEGKNPQELAPRVTQLASGIVTDVNRELVKAASDEDDFSSNWVVAVSPNGCPFCKSLTLEWGMDDEDLHFHDNCSCVVDASFKDEVKFRQGFHEQYLKDVEKARELIESGEAGERTVQAGSPEWTTQVKKQMAVDARTWRKGFEKKRNLSDEKRVENRNKTDKYVEAISEKAALVAKGKAQWNRNELDIMSGWGVDAETLTKPKTVPVASFTQKNLNVALDIVQGNRQIKE